MIVYVLFVHKKIGFKEKSLYFHKKWKIKKNKNNKKKTFLVGFLGGFFGWVFYCQLCLKVSWIMWSSSSWTSWKTSVGRPSSLTMRWAKARRSAARPVPSKMTTGTGGLEVTYSVGRGPGFTRFFKGEFFGFFLFFKHCFICRPSDSTVSEDAGIETRTVATTASAVRRFNHSARSHPHSQDLSHRKTLQGEYRTSNKFIFYRNIFISHTKNWCFRIESGLLPG